MVISNLSQTSSDYRENIFWFVTTVFNRYRFVNFLCLIFYRVCKKLVDNIIYAR